MVIKIARPKKDLNSLSAKVRENKKAQQTKVQGVFTCRECGEEKDSSEFYQSYGTKINVTHICKQCVIDGCLDDDGEYDLVLFQDMLRKLDKPFLNQIYITTVTKCSGSADSIVGTYMKNIHMAQYRGLTFANSDFGNINKVAGAVEKLDEEIKTQNEKIKNKSRAKNSTLLLKERRELQEKFGFNYTDEELNAFMSKYNQLKPAYPILSSLHEEALITYVRFRVKEEFATSRGDLQEASKWADMAQKQAQNARINPNQLTASDLTSGMTGFGDLARAVEQAVDVIPILPRFIEKPQDKVDFTIWCYVNYIRRMKGLPDADYKDIYNFYEDRKKEYEKENNVDIDKGEF